jgi:hypothetical protein
MTSCADAAYAAEEGEGGPLTVVVCDSAGVPRQTLTAALRDASSIFLKIGLKTEWLECSMLHVADQMDREWDIMWHRPRDPAHIILEMLPPLRSRGFAHETAGIALQPVDGSPGVCAGVFYDHAHDLARLGDASEAQILAYLVAHEIGHLLLGPGAHAASGIMQPEWTRGDLRAAVWGRLAFDGWQAERIRSAVLTRLASALH